MHKKVQVGVVNFLVQTDVRQDQVKTKVTNYRFSLGYCLTKHSTCCPVHVM